MDAEMNIEMESLLMSFIADGYSQSGKIKKSTALKMMKYVAKDPALQRAINDYNPKEILKYSRVK